MVLWPIIIYATLPCAVNELKICSSCGPRHEQWYPVAAGCTLHPCGGGKEGCLPCQGCTCGGREHPANARGGPVAAGRRDACTLNRGCPVAAAPTARGVPWRRAPCVPCVCGLSKKRGGRCALPCLCVFSCSGSLQGQAPFSDLFNGLLTPFCVDRLQ